jgi:hypothetical protein
MHVIESTLYKAALEEDLLHLLLITLYVVSYWYFIKSYVHVSRSRIAEMPASTSAYHGTVDLGCRVQVQLAVTSPPASV